MICLVNLLCMSIALPTASLTDFAFSDGLGIDPPGSRVGVVWHPGIAGYSWSELLDQMDLMESCGIKFVRIDFFWELIQPEEDTWTFHFSWVIQDKTIDDLLIELTRRNIRVLALIYKIPSWVSPDSWRIPESQVDKFEAFLSTLVHRYKSVIRYWQIGNEPDTPWFWPSGPNPEEFYEHLLCPAYNTIKIVDPEAIVVLAGVLGYQQRGRDYLNDLYVLGAKHYFDIATTHIYDYGLVTPTKISTTISLVRNIMQTNEDEGKTLWVTEMGTFAPEEADQASSADNCYSTLFQTSGIEKAFWYQFKGDNPDDTSGLISFSENKVKPSYNTVRGFSPNTPIPSTGSSTYPNVEFSWTAPVFANTYDLYVWETTQSRPETPWSSGLSTTNVTALLSLPGKSYFWQVITNHSSGLYASPLWLVDVIGEGESEGEADIPHPADLNVDWCIALNEAIEYLAGWQEGSAPIAYAIRAAYIWQNGEQYTYDVERISPMCWVVAL